MESVGNGVESGLSPFDCQHHKSDSPIAVPQSVGECWLLLIAARATVSV